MQRRYIQSKIELVGYHYFRAQFLRKFIIAHSAKLCIFFYIKKPTKIFLNELTRFLICKRFLA